jgi:hypothetical protein
MSHNVTHNVVKGSMCDWVDWQVAGYKVKCMIAEPKGKRSRLDHQTFSDILSPAPQVLCMMLAACQPTAFERTPDPKLCS